MVVLLSTATVAVRSTELSLLAGWQEGIIGLATFGTFGDALAVSPNAVQAVALSAVKMWVAWWGTTMVMWLTAIAKVQSVELRTWAVSWGRLT